MPQHALAGVTPGTDPGGTDATHRSPTLNPRLEGLADALFREAGDALFLFEPDTGQILEVNPTAQRLSGFSREELLELKTTFLLQAEGSDAQVRMQEAQHQTAQFHARDGFLLRTRQEGVWIPVNLTITRLHIKPRPLGLITARDVREHRDAYAKLKRVEAEMRRVLMSVSDCLWSAKVDSTGRWVYRYCSPVVESITGRTPKFFMDREEDPAELRWGRIVDPRDKARWEQAVVRMKAGESVQEEYRIVRLDGEVCWVRESVRVSRAGDRQAMLLDGVVTDITERKRVEQELREGEARKTATLDTALDCIISIDDQGRIIDFNKAAERTFGYSRNEILGQSMAELIMPPARRAEHYRGMDHFLATGEGPALGKRLELTALRSDGSEFPVELTVTHIPLEGSAIFTAFLRDVTDRKKAEEDLHAAKAAAESASQAKSEFLANMSHEIRTPLNGILGMAELAFGTALNPEQRRYLDILQASARSLLSLIEDILDFSKIEARKFELEEVEFSLRETLSDALGMLAIQAHQKHLELSYQVRSEVPDSLIGDAHRLRQILVNLVNNAIKFTDRGEILVEFGLAEALGERAPIGMAADQVALYGRVSDSGMGIPADKHQMIFDAFVQVDPSITRRHGGTGLGLGIVSQLVQMMGGQIWVESTVGRGSTFHFTACVRRGPHAGVLKAAIDTRTELLRGYRVLVADDNDNSRRILTELLAGWGLSTTAVADEQSAAVAFEQALQARQPFHLLLLDGIPAESSEFSEMNPYWHHLRAHSPDRVPVVLLLNTANLGHDAELCRKYEVDAYITKPVREALMLDILLHLLCPGEQAGIAPQIPLTAATPRRLQILLAEDNPVNQLFAAGVLEKQGHKVFTARNGREALAISESLQLDAILMDIEMPEMDGFAATAAIRRSEQSVNRHTPIIALTAHAVKGYREQCLAAGMNDYLAKPIRVRELLAALARFGVAGPDAKHPGNAHAHEPAADCSRQPFDREKALARLDGNTAMLATLAESYRQECPRLFDEIREGIDTHSAVQIRQGCHTLESMLRVLNAEPALKPLKCLGELGIAENVEQYQQALTDLAHELSRLDQALPGNQTDAALAMV